MKSKTLLLGLSTFMLIACNEANNSSSSINTLKEYGPNYKVENTTANQEYLYGMCDIAWSNYKWSGIDYTYESLLINNLGARSVRNWMHCNWIMNSPTEYNEDNLNLSLDIVEDLEKYNFQIIGMNHSNFHPSNYANSSSTTAKPRRNLEEGSEYLKWLEDYKTTWYNIVRKFPTIKYWEIDNEPNNDVFFPCLSGGNFTLKEKADIFTDMLYFASLGIHEANPDANTIMGGLIIDTAETFLQYIYDNIASDEYWSKYPDDYFQIACWHPYMSDFTESKFERTNNDIYAVIKTNEKKDKKVFLTEFGFSEGQVSRNKINEYLPKVYGVIANKLKYIESCHYFRTFDSLDSTWGTSAEKYFGLFTDPISRGIDNSNTTLGAPKTTAYTFQEMAKGKGSLTAYSDVLNNEE